jgi:hypothetical protein
MDEIVFSLFLSAFFLLVISVYYIFFKSKNEYGANHYLFLISSSLIILGCLIYFILSFTGGAEIKINKPHIYLFIIAILTLILIPLDAYRKKRNNEIYSKFILYFSVITALVIIIWGIVGFLR